jgi:Anp1
MKIFIGINTLTQLDQMVYANHIAFFYGLGKKFPEHQFMLFTPRRMSIDRMRNSAAKVALEAEADYLMFIDDDVVVPLNLLEELLKTKKDIVAGWTLIRGYPFKNMVFKFNEQGKLDNLPNLARKSGVIDVDAIGFSTALISCKVLKEVPPPWFVTGPTNTEDIYFCLKARQYVPDCTIAVNSDIETAHLIGSEFIAPWNVEAYKEYHRSINPDAAEYEKIPYLEKSGDRGEAYMNMVKGELKQREVDQLRLW